MNHIHKLQDVIRLQSEQIKAMQNQRDELETYLNSSKFHDDTTIQVQDVRNRLERVWSNMTLDEAIAMDRARQSSIYRERKELAYNGAQAS